MMKRENAMIGDEPTVATKRLSEALFSRGIDFEMMKLLVLEGVVTEHQRMELAEWVESNDCRDDLTIMAKANEIRERGQ